MTAAPALRTPVPAVAASDTAPDAVWLALCTHRLRERWPHVDVLTLEETASELWQREEGLRELAGREAAEAWLRRAWR